MPVEFFNINELSPELEATIDSEVADVMAAYQESREGAPNGWEFIDTSVED